MLFCNQTNRNSNNNTRYLLLLKKGLLMKRFLLSSAILMLALATSADTYPYLSFKKTDGTAVTFGVESLSMTFTDSGSKLTVTDGSTSQTFSVADIAKMFFATSNTTGISEMTTAKGDMQVYTTSGTYVGKFANTRSLDEAVEPGIYLVKQNGKTRKIAVR